jgi:DnaJ-domain-containing protein 1
MQQMEWEEHLDTISENKNELNKFKFIINKEYEQYSLLLETQIDINQDWDEAAITIDKLHFVEKLLNKINISLN